WLFVSRWTAGGNSLHIRAGDCGRDYRVLSAALLEVTFCGFPESVSDIVMTNIAANVPG
ncbi:sensor domain-containing protein, partial [Mycobacterium tuberculosis]